VRKNGAMRPITYVIVLRLALLAAVAASTVLLIDYLHAGDPAFCGIGTGCMAIRSSAYGQPFRLDLPGGPYVLSLPLAGLTAYATLFAASLLIRGRGALRVLAAFLALGGLCGALLIGIQVFVVHAVCVWCFTVDVCAILAGVVSSVLAVRAGRGALEDAWLAALVRRAAIPVNWVAAGVLAAGLPFLWARYPVLPPVPAEIAALSVPGHLTMIEFTDFECPFCRKLHDEIQLIEREDTDLRLARVMAPLPMHPGAYPAALAYLCAPARKQEAIANALYRVSEVELTTEGTAAIAKKLGVSSGLTSFCVSSPDMKAAVEKDLALFASVGKPGLPLTFVGQHMVLGYNPEGLRKAIQLEETGPHLALPVSWMLGIIGLAAAAASALTWRMAPREEVKAPAGDEAPPAGEEAPPVEDVEPKEDGKREEDEGGSGTAA
jgi:uncharacterized membrane protein